MIRAVGDGDGERYGIDAGAKWRGLWGRLTVVAPLWPFRKRGDG